MGPPLQYSGLVRCSGEARAIEWSATEKDAGSCNPIGISFEGTARVTGPRGSAVVDARDPVADFTFRLAVRTDGHSPAAHRTRWLIPQQLRSDKNPSGALFRGGLPGAGARLPSAATSKRVGSGILSL